MTAPCFRNLPAASQAPFPLAGPIRRGEARTVEPRADWNGRRLARRAKGMDAQSKGRGERGIQTGHDCIALAYRTFTLSSQGRRGNVNAVSQRFTNGFQDAKFAELAKTS